MERQENAIDVMAYSFRERLFMKKCLKMIHLNSSIWLFILVTVILATAGCNGDNAAKKQLQLGDTAPDFAVKTLAGEIVVLSSLKGRPVILRFFETGCRFCRADTPAFNSFYNRHKDAGLQVLYIGSFYENREALEKFVDELGLSFPVAMDEGAKLADLYGIKAYPQTIFIGPEQQLLAALLGGVGEAEMDEILGSYMTIRQ